MRRARWPRAIRFSSTACAASSSRNGPSWKARSACGSISPIKRSKWHKKKTQRERAMETIGFVGVGKIGMPIVENLIKSGFRVVGFRRSSLAEFEKIGGVPARSAADVGAQADIVLSCLPSTEALDDAMQGPKGLVQSARPGQIVIELGSHPVPDKK